MNIEDKINQLQIEGRAYINGAYVNGVQGKKLNKKSSFDGRELPEIAACTEEDVEAAVKCAKEAYESGVWRNKEPEEKKQILLKLADIMEEHREELAMLDALETGRAYKNYYYDSIPKAIAAIRYYAEAIDKYYDQAIPAREKAFATIQRIPLGVVGIITPWNDPMVVSAWKFTPALLMGNSVIMKPAEQSSLSIIRVARLATEAGIPDGVFNVLPGKGEITGKALALNMDVRGIYFTGSSEVGKQIIQYSGMSNMKKVGLECGGKSPFIVSEKYRDIKGAAQVLAKNMFYNQGQICSAPSRVIVASSIAGDFMKYLKEECENFVPGNPFDIENEVGCVVSREQYDKIEAYIELARKEGAEVYQAMTRKDMPDTACAIQPTIISGITNQSRIAQEEIFGPVVAVIEARDLREAVEVANDTKYGLAGAVFTDDFNEAYYAANHIQAGLVHINSYGEDENNTPFGGIKESGIGKDRSIFAFDEYSQQKTIWMTFKEL